MADTLRARVARIIAGGAHALLDSFEDLAPLAALEQSVREVAAITDEVRSELGRAVANRHLTQQRHVVLNREHEELSAAIAQALSAARDDLAKAAVARQIDIEAQLPILEGSLAELCAQEREHSAAVDALLGKQREMEHAIRAFEASRASATVTNTAQGTLASGLLAKIDTAQAAFDRTYQRQTGLNLSGSRASLELTAKLNELGHMVRENKINERLAALKTA